VPRESLTDLLRPAPLRCAPDPTSMFESLRVSRGSPPALPCACAPTPARTDWGRTHAASGDIGTSGRSAGTESRMLGQNVNCLSAEDVILSPGRHDHAPVPIVPRRWTDALTRRGCQHRAGEFPERREPRRRLALLVNGNAARRSARRHQSRSANQAGFSRPSATLRALKMNRAERFDPVPLGPNSPIGTGSNRRIRAAKGVAEGRSLVNRPATSRTRGRSPVSGDILSDYQESPGGE